MQTQTHSIIHLSSLWLGKVHISCPIIVPLTIINIFKAKQAFSFFVLPTKKPKFKSFWILHSKSKIFPAKLYLDNYKLTFLTYRDSFKPPNFFSRRKSSFNIMFTENIFHFWSKWFCWNKVIYGSYKNNLGPEFLCKLSIARMGTQKYLLTKLEFAGHVVTPTKLRNMECRNIKSRTVKPGRLNPEQQILNPNAKSGTKSGTENPKN